MGCPAKVNGFGLADNPARVPVPDTVKPKVPWSVPTVTVALVAPGLVGVNDTGMLKDAPAANDTGSVGAVTAHGEGTETDEIFTARAAVNFNEPVAFCPTATEPTSSEDAVNALVVGRPKAIRLPSRVPT